MALFDWLILFGFLIFTIWEGARSGVKATNIRDYFLAGRTMSWWSMGLSVMATQASAITFISATGLAFTENMKFIQMYLSVPFAMVILCVTLVPFFYNRETYSAYEVLEQRFGLATRLLTSALFLISRGLALGTVIAAPAYVLALLLGIKLHFTIIIIGVIATLYTMAGGIAGVIKTDVKQMAIMLFGVFFSIGFIWYNLPNEVGFGGAVKLAGALGKLESIDWSLDFSDRYNVWSGVIAGLFLMLSYFGSDQTQVQRYLTAKSLKDARESLLVSAVAKVPMQFIILFLGVLLYVFYIFSSGPITFRTSQVNDVSGGYEIRHEMRESMYQNVFEQRKSIALEYLSGNESKKENFLELDEKLASIRKEEIADRESIDGIEYNDTNYIFPYFILSEMPVGVIGLIIAAIFAAALSSIDSALNALSTCSIVDWYQRLHKKPRDDIHYVKASRISTLMWGVLATLAALALGETGSIIELVNQLGSYFYGSILGIFVLLLWFKNVEGNAAIIALATGMITVFFCDNFYTIDGEIIHSWFTSIPNEANPMLSYLWLNPIGTGVVVFVGWILGLLKIK